MVSLILALPQAGGIFRLGLASARDAKREEQYVRDGDKRVDVEERGKEKRQERRGMRSILIEIRNREYQSQVPVSLSQEEGCL